MVKSNPEKKLFSYLKSHFSKNDYVKIDKTFVPEHLSNSLNRFYNEKSMCFSRLKVSNTESIYYFALKNDEMFIPKFILKYDKNSLSSTIIRFNKEDLYISIHLEKNSRAYNKIKKVLPLKFATKSKKSNFYYINLGNLNSEDLINNIEYLFSNFKFDNNLENNYLYIIDIDEFDDLPTDDCVDDIVVGGFDDPVADDDGDDDAIVSGSEDRNNDLVSLLEFNLNAFRIKEIIKNLNLSENDKDELDNYIFIRNKSGDYGFSENIPEKWNITKTFDILIFSLYSSKSNDLSIILKDIDDNLNSGETFPLNDDTISYGEEKALNFEKFSHERISIDNNSDNMEYIWENESNNGNILEVSEDEISDELFVGNVDRFYMNLSYEDTDRLYDKYVFDDDNSENMLSEDDVLIDGTEELMEESHDLEINSIESEGHISEEQTHDFKFNMELTGDVIDEIISFIVISMSEFAVDNLDDEEKNKLISDLESYTSNLIFKFSTKNFNDEERSHLIEKIKSDINQGIVYGDISKIVSYYFDSYSELKNNHLSNCYWDEFIESESYKYCLDFYDIDEKDVNKIINKIKDEIAENEIVMDEIQTKFKIYLKGFESKKDQYKKLNALKNKISLYSRKYNLTKEELSKIHDLIKDKIDNTYGVMNSIEFYWRKEIENQLLINQSEARRKLSSFSIDQLKTLLNLDEDECEIVLENAGRLIYENKLRSDEINEEYLIKLSKEI